MFYQGLHGGKIVLTAYTDSTMGGNLLYVEKFII